MSKLFHDMQDAARFCAEQPAKSQALTELLDSVGAAPVAAPDPAIIAQGDGRKLDIPQLRRPFLMADDETPATHRAFEGYRALRTKLVRFQSGQGVRSIVVTSAEAGEGKTVSVLNLALSLAQLPSQRILIVDADLRTGGLSKAAGAMERPGLAEVLAGELSFEKVPVATNIANLYIVPAGEATKPAGDLFSGPHFKQFIGWCNESFTMILVDCPPMIGLADFDVLSTACDGVLLVVRAQRTKRERLTDLVPHLRDHKLLGILLNGQERSRTRSQYGYYYSKIGKH